MSSHVERRSWRVPKGKPHEPLQAQQQEHLHNNQLFNNRLLAAKSAAADPIQAVPSELIIDI